MLGDSLYHLLFLHVVIYIDIVKRNVHSCLCCKTHQNIVYNGEQGKQNENRKFNNVPLPKCHALN